MMNLTLGSISIAIKSGALIPLLLMLPNLLWMLLPKTDAVSPVSEPLFLTIIENVGRIAILVLPFFFSLDLNKRFSVPVMVVMGLALGVYYGSWLRYFAGGGSIELFSTPFLGIPLPMATAPVLFLVLASYLMSSWLVLGAAVLFGAAHIWVSALVL
jgi:hypothetical protein